MTETEALQSGLTRIRQRFLLNLDIQADDLFQLLERLGNTHADHATCTEIHAIAHRIHGTAKTIGFAEIGVKSAELELYISQAMLTSGPLDAMPIFDLLENLLDEIESTLRGD